MTTSSDEQPQDPSRRYFLSVGAAATACAPPGAVEATETPSPNGGTGPSILLTQADPRERGIGEHSVGDQPVARTAMTAGQIVPDDAF